jgi:hypothetical protein
MPVPGCFGYNSFVLCFEVSVVIPPTLGFLHRISLALLSLLWFHMNFRIVCFISMKNVIGILIEIILNL